MVSLVRPNGVLMFILLVSLAFADVPVFSPAAEVAAAPSIAACQGGASAPECQEAIDDSGITPAEQIMLRKDCAIAGAEICATDWLKIHAVREVWRAQGIYHYVRPGSTPKPRVVKPAPLAPAEASGPAPTVTITPLSEDPMVDVKTIVPNIEVDLRYATSRNFLNVSFYDDATCYVTLSTAERLKAAQTILTAKRSGYRLLIWDCARPLKAQQIMWGDCVVRNDVDYCEGLVANPHVSPSNHIYGRTVDVSLIGPDWCGCPAAMPTDHDSGLYLGDDEEDKRRARPPMPGSKVKPELWSDAQFDNYELLADAMTAAGFTPIGSEWWHFESD